jgi:peptidoglycan hydrolase-like protein with peptidoglycan-binding domain
MGSKILSVGDFGDEVTKLHENLKNHGFKVSPEEEKRKFFGPTTREAVGEFQKAHGIDPSCEVCDSTAAHLSTEPAKKPEDLPIVTLTSAIEKTTKSENVVGTKDTTVIPKIERAIDVKDNTEPLTLGAKGNTVRIVNSSINRFYPNIPISFKETDKSNVNNLHQALTKLNLSVDESEKNAVKIGKSTAQAIKNFQTENNLPANGELDEKTISTINVILHDKMFTTSKHRTTKIHTLLQRLNLPIDKEELSKRNTGISTRKAIEEFQKKIGLPADGKLSEEVLDNLQEEVIKARLTSTTQVGLLQNQLLKINKISKLNLEIAPNELQSKQLGETSKAVIQAFQTKYKLPVTGAIDKATLDKMESAAASKGTFVKKIGKTPNSELVVLNKKLKLNVVSPHVNKAQKAFSYLGYKISQKEFNTQTFGKTTRDAVLAFQKSKGLPQTGHLGTAEIKALNYMVAEANPNVEVQHKYRVRGSVRDELWQRKPNMVIKVFEKLLDKESDQPLVTKKNLLNGFFDITYDAPLNSISITKQVKDKFHLIVKLYEPQDNNPANDKFVSQQTLYNVNRIHWVNFTQGDSPYQGESDFEVVNKIVQKAIGNGKIIDLHETETDKQISQLALQTGFSTDDIMRLILAYRAANNVNLLDPLSPEVFYAFVRQNFPPNLPGDLLRGTSDWETIEQMTELTASGIVLMTDELVQKALDMALEENLVSRVIKVNLDGILAAFKAKRNQFTLSKPILIGNQNLQALLANSIIEAAHYPKVANTFLLSKGINTDFWENIKTEAPEINADAVADFANTIEIGNLAKNHLPTVTFFKQKIGVDPRFTTASSFAKLDHNELVALINENGNNVPDNMPGEAPEAKVAAYAAAMKSRMELIFPAVSLVAEIKRSNTDKLTKISDVEKFLDEHPDLDFKRQNIDKYLLDKNIHLEVKTKEEVKVVQRVHKLAGDSQTGTTLIDAGLHSSMQIYFAGQDRLKSLLTAKGIEDQKSLRLYESAKIQYLQILARLMDFRREANVGTPAAIISQTYSKAEIQELLGDIPNLELLFGSLDFCECEHCKSLYSPAAYLTDLLRFIGEHNSLVKKNPTTFLSVKEILFQRRPDLGNIKLSCENTNTALPYIDLVCEILENYVEPKQPNFSYQTTLNSKELRAIPQYVRTDAYKTLAVADFPMNSSFNLFQEETRTYLNYLRVPHYKLMEVFQDISNPALKVPNDVVIAAEYFAISEHEKNLIITQKQTQAEQDIFWGFTTSQTTVSVRQIMNRAKLSYNQLLELLLVRFVNDPASPNRSEIVRPVDSCDTSVQSVNNLTVSKFDLMHRFIRLWRKTGWKMWELDLLIRNSKIGNNLINDDTLINLKRFHELQNKLKLSVEVLLSFYGEINRELRIQPDKPDIKINPLYQQLFQNIAVTNPVDSHFVAIDSNDQPIALDSTIIFGINAAAPFNGYAPVPTILSALALTQADFDLLVAKTNNQLSVNSLSTLLRYAYFARRLKLSVKDLFLLLSVTNTADPFVDLKTTLECIKNLDYIRSSNTSLLELDYILNFSPASPIGLRDETFIQYIDGLRKTLNENQDEIDKLELTQPNQTAVLGFNADALQAMSDPNLIAALVPLQNILNTISEKFKDNGFSVEETFFIIQFNTASISAANKTKLVESIKLLQLNLQDLLNQHHNLVKAIVASAFNLNASQANIILTNIQLTKPLIEILEDKVLIDKNPDGSFIKAINRSNFPSFFDAYTLIHKVALVIARLKITDEDLEWFISNQGQVETLNFNAIPVSSALSPNDFKGWLNLFKFLDFKSNFPEPENASIRSMLDLAKKATSTKDQIFDEIVKLTQWIKPELVSLDAKFHLNHVAGTLDYTKAETYSRFKKCIDQMKLTGVDAATMFDWALIDDNLDHDVATSVQSRKAVKSKYEQDDWLQKITPLHDDIREKKRVALVEYHIENSQRSESETIPDPTNNAVQIPNPQFWRDSLALYKYFLIDVEMSPCQLTSRIKQAISSVQFFVQRCFLNLENRYVKVSMDEKEDVASPNAWSQWKWMKNYRIWEANRKVFFYPENWIEPELRDDKSPFFEELENEIMQNDVTKENVEAAFLSYLHKVDEVSHLEVCGLYHEMENLSGDETIFEINTVHVIGRTKAIPHLYYYRRYDMNYDTWGAWEKIDVEIQGDQVVPVVYNRKLHLFWLQFMEKPMKTTKVPPAKPSNGPSTAAEPMKVMEIQLGWTVKKSGGWASKKISKQKLIHPWERPHYSYNLKPYYQSKLNELYLDIYLSTSKEFNDGRFYDPIVQPESNPVYLTKNRFNETFLPWHSSSFIFDGAVKEVKLKGLGGKFLFFWLENDSFDYVHNSFGKDGEAILELDPKLEYGPRLKLPNGMHFEGAHLTNNKVHAANPNQLRVLENTVTTPLLNSAINPFELVITQQDLQLNTVTTNHPLFYQDNKRSFFIKPEWETIFNNYGQVISHNRKYRFLPFYHPYTMLFIREFNRDGIDGLLNRRIQTSPQGFQPANNFNFAAYSPSTTSVIVDKTVQTDINDFSLGGAYSIYNWELFFHAPLMIACRLMQNQKFEDAMNWFHYIFNPTNIDNLPTPQRYWITKPFFEFNSEDYRKQRIQQILSNIGSLENQKQLTAWKNNPFKPHLIARYRPVAYQKNVVMKYLDNLIAWGDMLFGRDTIESINEAALLYLLAYEILGDRPQKVPNVKHEEMTFNEIEPKLDEFANARVDVVIEDTLLPITVTPSTAGTEPIPKIETFYFCIPANDYLTKYWDTVEDRFFKIRHCMNIQGIVRQLPLFEPPIDPALLVKAAAAGLDLSSVLNDLAAPTPHYRFRVVIQKAVEFCNDVRMLGEKLLAALEKKDVEELSVLRSQHEIQLLEAVKEIRKKQIDEAVEIIGSLNKTLEGNTEKESYYSQIPRMNTWEDFGAGAHLLGIGSEIGATIANTLAAGIYLIPQFKAGASGFGATPVAVLEWGGDQPGKAASKFAALFQGLSSIFHSTGNLLESQGNYTRRDDENKFQSRLVVIEKDQIQFQINAAEIRQTIAEKELENQELQIENAKLVDDFMRNKYTNQQLFSWMITQISTVYFQAYQLAFEMAKKAEKCYQYELGITESNIIQFGYWDSLKKGLLSGDKLVNDLRRLESAYLDQNKREFEITKHISLHQMFPLSLITLKETGKCTVSLPEWIFDMDYPGHYMRRIKKVSISIPCIVGPYTGVNCTLSLLRNETRILPTLAGGNYAKVDENDERFRMMFGAISSIATSHAQNDSGLFELNFSDERYLPFEGAGAISDWQIDLPIENNQFDFSSLSDVILHISYTSRNGGGLLSNGANTNVQAVLPNSAARLFSLKHEFSNEWYKFLNPANNVDQEFVINLKPEHFPFIIRGKLNALKIKKLDLFIQTDEENDFTTSFKVTNGNFINDLPVSVDPDFNNVHHLQRDLSTNALGEFRLKLKLSSVNDYKSLAADKVEDMFLLLQLGLGS